MRCQQCDSVMLMDQLIESIEPRWRCVWRCLDCGETVNPPLMEPNEAKHHVADSDTLFRSGMAIDLV